MKSSLTGLLPSKQDRKETLDKVIKKIISDAADELARVAVNKMLKGDESNGI